MVRRKDRTTARRSSAARAASRKAAAKKPPIRRPGEKRSAETANSLEAPAVEADGAVHSDDWFTVDEAAELLTVSPSRIFDGIRDGKLRVRFRAATPGGSERPLVSSDELARRARERREGAVAPAAAEAKGAPGGAPSKAEAPPIAFIETSARPRDEGEVTRTAKPVAGAETDSASPRLESPAETPVLPKPEEPSEKTGESQLTPTGQGDAARRTVKEFDRELAAARRQVEEAEDRVEQSLRAVYERDVKVARLESQLEASAQVRQAGEMYVGQLQERLTRVEDRSEEKEREIRRLALGLGEARGEVRLLRPPVEVEARRRWRLLPWLLPVTIGGVIAWMAWLIATNDGRPGEIAVLATVGALAAYFLGHRLSRDSSS